MKMKVEFHYLPEFERRAKVLAKKYKSFRQDYDDFLDSLEEAPFQGTSLGGGVYKTRMQIVSKGKGKSGGARVSGPIAFINNLEVVSGWGNGFVLTYNLKKIEPDRISITFLSIFDKSDMENVSDSYIKSLVKDAT